MRQFDTYRSKVGSDEDEENIIEKQQHHQYDTDLKERLNIEIILKLKETLLSRAGWSWPVLDYIDLLKMKSLFRFVAWVKPADTSGSG